MNEVQMFQYTQTTEVRMVMLDNEPWWVLADVCRVLELTSPHKVAERLDDDEKGRSPIPTPGGIQEMAIINESGLYSVILRSDKPQAKAFKRWITHEVLPSIRKTGEYSTRAKLEQASIGAPHLRKTAKMLWYILLHLEVEGEVQISNQRLMELMNVKTENTVRAARRELERAGCITFTPGSKCHPSRYKLTTTATKYQTKALP